MTKATHIQLVTIAKRENEASIIEGHLRDGGQPVRMKWLKAVEGLDLQLADPRPDLIFCEARDPKLRDYALRCCSTAAAEVPILFLCDEINAEAVDTALKKRARDAVSINHLEHLQAVYMRELAAAKLESNLRDARNELRTLKARMDSLVSVSQLAVANLQDGIFVDSSNDFSQLFGYTSPDALTSLPFLELISTEDRARIKKMINRCASGKSNGDETETHGLSASGEIFALLLRIARVETAEGNCVEIQARREGQEAPEQISEQSQPENKPAAPSEQKPAVAAPESPKVPVIDEALSAKIITALTNEKYRVKLLPFITLDGQQSTCSDGILELQDEKGLWFNITVDSNAAPKVLHQCDRVLFEESSQLLSTQLSEGQAATLLIPLFPACLDTPDELTALLEREVKIALDGGQNLVITFNEKHFAQELERSKAFANKLRAMGVRIAMDQIKANEQTVEMIQALEPDYACLDRASTQLLVTQGSEHPQLSKIMALSREKGMHIVAYPLQDAHSMAMLWQRGVNMVRNSEQQAAG